MIKGDTRARGRRRRRQAAKTTAGRATGVDEGSYIMEAPVVFTPALNKEVATAEGKITTEPT